MADTLGTRAQVTLSLDDLDSLRQEIFASSARVEKLTQQIEAMKYNDSSGLVPDLCQTIRAAIKVVQFAVGNLDPSIVRGWPHQDLAKFIEGIERMPIPDEDASVRIGMREMAHDMKSFVRTAAQYEEYRRQNAQGLIVASPSDFGPQTVEAQAIHAASERHNETMKNES
jgi:hypothetical protein